MKFGTLLTRLLMTAAAILSTGCDPADSARSGAHDHHGHGSHHHEPPHGGTAVVLGEESHHLELLLAPGSSTLSLYVLDGHMEEFVRIAAPSVTLEIQTPATSQTVELHAVPNRVTGETIGSTSMFASTNELWATVQRFQGKIPGIEIQGARYTNVTFAFPEGNE